MSASVAVVGGQRLHNTGLSAWQAAYISRYLENRDVYRGRLQQRRARGATAEKSPNRRTTLVTRAVPLMSNRSFSKLLCSI